MEGGGIMDIDVTIRCECGTILDRIEVKHTQTGPEFLMAKCENCADDNYTLGKEEAKGE